jgi:hypothetical protein
MPDLTPDQIQQMIQMLQAMLPKEDKEKSEPTASNTNYTRTHKKEFINKFDQMQESRLHKEDIAIDKALSVYGPTPRTRQFDPINVQCRVCGKKESINPNMLHDAPSRYKCNECSRSPG